MSCPCTPIPLKAMVAHAEQESRRHYSLRLDARRDSVARMPRGRSSLFALSVAVRLEPRGSVQSPARGLSPKSVLPKDNF